MDHETCDLVFKNGKYSIASSTIWGFVSYLQESKVNSIEISFISSPPKLQVSYKHPSKEYEEYIAFNIDKVDITDSLKLE